ncbi:MAG TPA: rhomboid family intramembrane serine protease [Acidimicrobiales bacterium]|nr:rhomboid family intramembrane serine protease [Acidimicrobiales bacterium]
MTAPSDVRTCYRHPDRVAGIVCQRCDRPICPSCMHQAAVGFHCPDCANRGAQKVYRGPAALRTRPLVTQALIGVNLAVFLLDLVTRGMAPWTTGGQLLAVRGWGGGIQADGLLLGSFVPEEPWRLVAGGFLHGGLLHVGLNMWSLFVVGSVLEPALGRLRFSALYGASLLAGSLGVVLASPTSPTVGASGAIFGLMGALLLVARERNIDLVRSGLLPIVGFNLAITFLSPGLSVGGHLGGLAGGLAFGAVLVHGRRVVARQAPAATAAVVAVLGVACGLGAYLLMAAEYGPT